MGSNETRKAFLRAAFSGGERPSSRQAAAAVFLVLMMPQTEPPPHRRHGDVRRVPGQDRSGRAGARPL